MWFARCSGKEEAVQPIQVSGRGPALGWRNVEQPDIEKLKTELHRTLISKLDLEKLSRVNSSQARASVADMIHEIVVSQRVPLSFEQQEKVQDDLLDEVFGLGPLEPLLNDATISDILVNDKDHVFIERKGILQRVNVSFRDDRHLLQIIDRIVSRVGAGWTSPRPWWMRGYPTARA